MICTVVAALPEPDLVLPPDGFLIAADKGYAQLHARGVVPDLVVGDFDSLGAVPQDVPVVRHPVRKDDTDMLLAVREGLRRGCTRFLLYGGVGGRLDHTLANLQTLSFLQQNGARGVLYGDGTAVTLLHQSGVTLSAKESGDVSVFAFGGPARGVTERGLLYSLENATLTTDFPLGVSNGFCGNAAQIEVRQGSVLLLWQTDANAAVTFLQCL